MASVERAQPTTSIDPATQLGAIALGVADLDRSARFYADAIGLVELGRSGREAVFGVDGRPLLLLTEQPGALPWMTDGMTGLYHFAILVPTRTDLGRWLRHYLTTVYPPPGQGDHVVSEALYLRDPDGHGIEVYADRPREGWVWTNGRVKMGGGPVDVRGLFAEAERDGRAWGGMPPGTTLGHVHLQVGDLAKAEAFYRGALGFEVVAGGDTALFVSAGRYHHHLGLNTWHSKDARPAPPDTARLRFFTIQLPSDQALRAALERAAAAGVPAGRSDGASIVTDPWGNRAVLHVGDLASAQDALALSGQLPAR
jgi:catechol 2,3-dioxygenase